MSQTLVRYDAMRIAIMEAHAVDEVKDIRDKALALEEYARQANDTDLERQVHDIRVRAEQRAGELLSIMPKAKGTQGQLSGPTIKVAPEAETKLSDLGISHKQSALWQKLAAVPKDEFEEALGNPLTLATAAHIVAAHEAKNAPPEERTIPVDPDALWLWGRLQDFERKGLLARDPSEVCATMLEHMEETTRELAPIVAKWLRGIGK